MAEAEWQVIERTYFDQSFFLADGDDNTLEIEISSIARGRYAVKYRNSEWPEAYAGGW